MMVLVKSCSDCPFCVDDHSWNSDEESVTEWYCAAPVDYVVVTGKDDDPFDYVPDSCPLRTLITVTVALQEHTSK